MVHHRFETVRPSVLSTVPVTLSHTPVDLEGSSRNYLSVPTLLHTEPPTRYAETVGYPDLSFGVER